MTGLATDIPELWSRQDSAEKTPRKISEFAGLGLWIHAFLVSHN